MADEQFQEKTETATPKRVKESRDKGQLPRSRELTTMAITLSAAITIFLYGQVMLADIASIMINGLQLARADVIATDRMLMPLQAALAAATSALTPWLIMIAAVATLAPMALGGWSFSTSALKFKGDRINPLAGLKRLFAMRGLIELIKAMAKFLLVGGVAVLVLQSLAGEFIGLGREPLRHALGHSGWLMSISFLFFSSVLLVIAAIDVPFQIHDHAKKMRMTKQEVKDESKETEGRPEVRSRIRGLQQELANKRMMEDIPIASVVITNPTHFAVALRYDEDDMDAPKVVAKGADHLAKRIREVAAEHGVPIFESPPLARALFDSTEIGDEIDERLYVGVAQVLTYLFQVDQYVAHGGLEPEPPKVEVPLSKE